MYFRLVNKLAACSAVKNSSTTLKQVVVKDPGIHVSGTFQDYLRAQVG